MATKNEDQNRIEYYSYTIWNLLKYYPKVLEIVFVVYCNDIIITFSYEKDTADTDRLISSFYE